MSNVSDVSARTAAATTATAKATTAATKKYLKAVYDVEHGCVRLWAGLVPPDRAPETDERRFQIVDG